jgi:site-specific DNA recombinase
MTKITTAIIYCRVSTDNQEKEGTSLQTQEEACIEYCHKKGYEVFKRFIETYSGLTLDRPKLTELRDLINTSDIDVVVVYCLDRLTRDPNHGVILTQELEKANIQLEAVTETIEQTALGNLITYIRGFNSKIEAEKIKERTMRGKRAHLKMGNLPQGTGIGIYGYKWDKSLKKRVIIDSEAQTVKNIFAMALKGYSFNKMAIKLNNSGIKSKSGSMWHPLTIRRIAVNPSYTGKTYYGQTKRIGKTKVIAQPKENWILLTGVTPAIISDEIFNLAQESIKLSKLTRPLKPNASYLLTGFIKCAKCGSPIGGTMLQGKYRYYQCRGSKPTSTRGKICDAGYIKANEIEQFVWSKVSKIETNPYTLISNFLYTGYNSSESMKPKVEKQISLLKKKIKTYEFKEKNLYDLLSSEIVTKDYVLDAINKLRQEKEKNSNDLKELLDIKINIDNFKFGNIRVSELTERMRNLYSQSHTLQDKRNILKDFNLSVEAIPGNYKVLTLVGTQYDSDNYVKDMLIKKDHGTRAFNLDNYSDDDLKGIDETIKEFEIKHPNITFGDIIDYSKILPEDTAFGRVLNKEKAHLVTIEQTSASPHARSCRSRPV